MKKAFILAICFASLVSAKTFEKEFEHQFEDVQKDRRLILKHGDGDVTIETWNQDRIDVLVYYKISATGLTSMNDDFYVEFIERNTDYMVIGHEPSIRVFMGGVRVNYTYHIKMPAYVTLKTLGADGDIEISDHEADIDIRLTDGDIYLADCEADEINLITTDGDIRLKRINADLSIQSTDGKVDIDESSSNLGSIRLTDGDIRLSHAKGNFRLQSTDGDIDLNRMHVSQLFAKSSDGDITIDIIQTTDTDVDIETGDGDIVLTLPSSTNAGIRAYSNDGEIKSTIDNISEKESHEHYFQGIMKNGDGYIKIRTGDGDIYLYDR